MAICLSFALFGQKQHNTVSFWPFFMKFLTAFRLLLIGLWLGAAVFFVAVAQSSFAILPSRDLAGNLVSRMLAILNYGGIGIAVIALLTSLIVPDGIRKVGLWAERVLLLIFGLGCAVCQFVISWWMLMVRTEMGRPIEEVPVDDPLRIQFNNLHEYSSWLIIIATVAALLAFAIIATRTKISGKNNGIDPLDFQKQFKI
jgi:hypothetical protein